jgi:REP element-mobilizing transposase RayT
MAKKQLSFSGDLFKVPKASFGGSLLKNSHAKTKRPLESKLPIHLVLRANKSQFRTHKSFKRVNDTVASVCKKHGVKLYKYANVGNHLHMAIKIRSRPSWAAFIRELTGRIAQLEGIKWLKRPFTRIVGGWKKAYCGLLDYITLNQLEGDDIISRAQIRTLRELREVWAESA